jgi:hypothetical protein
VSFVLYYIFARFIPDKAASAIEETLPVAGQPA